MGKIDAEACPRCGVPGKEVPKKVPLQHLNADGIAGCFLWEKAWICLQPPCECLYFNGGEWVGHSKAAKKVGFKSGEDSGVLCFCFGYTVKDLAVPRGDGREKPLERIEAYLRKGGSLCEVTHPSGESCLGSIQGHLRCRG